MIDVYGNLVIGLFESYFIIRNKQGCLWCEGPTARVVLPRHYAFHSQWLGDLKLYIISRKRAVKSTIDKAVQERGSKEMQKARDKDPGETMGREGGPTSYPPLILLALEAAWRETRYKQMCENPRWETSTLIQTRTIMIHSSWRCRHCDSAK